MVDITPLDIDTKERVVRFEASPVAALSLLAPTMKSRDGIWVMRLDEGVYYLKVVSPGFKTSIARYSLNCESANSDDRVFVTLPLVTGHESDVVNLRQGEGLDFIDDDEEYHWLANVEKRDEERWRNATPEEREKKGFKVGKKIRIPRPNYPPELRSRNIVGTVRVEISIDKQGNVKHARAVSGPVEFFEVAEKAAMKAKFEPTTFNGFPIEVAGTIEFNFGS
ncbi:MAG: energy transducer TonB [Aridibacter famidurans]|nr:energy transducer TonB [Aridibacter famidurans]